MASQCPNERVMMIEENGDIVTDNEDADNDDMPPLEEALEKNVQ